MYLRTIGGMNSSSARDPGGRRLEKTSPNYCQLAMHMTEFLATRWLHRDLNREE